MSQTWRIIAIRYASPSISRAMTLSRSRRDDSRVNEHAIAIASRRRFWRLWLIAGITGQASSMGRHAWPSVCSGPRPGICRRLNTRRSYSRAAPSYIYDDISTRPAIAPCEFQDARSTNRAATLSPARRRGGFQFIGRRWQSLRLSLATHDEPASPAHASRPHRRCSNRS